MKKLALTITIASMLFGCSAALQDAAKDLAKDAKATAADKAKDSQSSTSSKAPDASSNTTTSTSTPKPTDSSTSTPKPTDSSTSTPKPTASSAPVAATTFSDFSVFSTGIPHPDKVKSFTSGDIAKAKELWQARYDSVATDPWKVLHLYIEAYMVTYRNKELAKELLSVVEKSGEVDNYAIGQAEQDPKGGRMFRSYWKGTTPDKDYMEIWDGNNFANRQLDSRENKKVGDDWPALDPKSAPLVHNGLKDPKPGDFFYFYIKSTGADFPRKANLIMNSKGQWKTDPSKNSAIWTGVRAPANLDF